MANPVRNNADKPGLAEATPHYLGHRERLRERFLDGGPDAVTEYELLELVLFRAIPRRDVKPLAKALIATFGSFGEVVSAPRQRLREIEGLGEAAIAEVKIVQAAANRLARGAVKKRTVLSSWSAVLDYCRSTMAFADKEQFRVLFLDKRNQLISDELQQVGTVDHTGLSARGHQTRAGTVGHRDHPGAQPSLRRSDAVAGRYPDDQGDHRHCRPARHRPARPHHRRQERACEFEGAAADLASQLMPTATPAPPGVHPAQKALTAHA